MIDRVILVIEITGAKALTAKERIFLEFLPRPGDQLSSSDHPITRWTDHPILQDVPTRFS